MITATKTGDNVTVVFDDYFESVRFVLGEHESEPFRTPTPGARFSRGVDSLRKPGKMSDPHWFGQDASGRCQCNKHTPVDALYDGCGKLGSEVERRSEPLFERLAPRVKTIDFELSDECGEDWDVAIAMSGDPNYNLAAVEREAYGMNTEPLRVVADGGFLGDTDRRSIFEHGSKVATLINLIEYAGRAVELWLNFTKRTHGGALITFRVLAKASSEPLAINRLAYLLAHEGSNRSYVFGMQDRLDADKHHGEYARAKLVDGSRGSTWYMDAAERKDYDLHINNVEHGSLSEYQLINALRTLGIEVEGEDD